jgi:N-methylhydantoinase B/oxoprolinase/acetone carboxylase alpha subunit
MVKYAWADGEPFADTMADRRLEVLIERHGRDAVQEITEAVLDHCMEFRQRVINAPTTRQEIADEGDALHEAYKDDPRLRDDKGSEDAS